MSRSRSSPKRAEGAAAARGVELYNRGDFEGAIALFEEAARRRPADENIRLFLSAARASAGRTRDAARDHLEAGRYAEALAQAGERPAIRGAARLLLGDPAAALADLDRALKLEPRDVEAALWRGEALRRLGRNREALETLDQGLKEWAYSLRGHLNRALAKLALGVPVPPGDYEQIRKLAPGLRGRSAAALEKALRALKGVGGKTGFEDHVTRLKAVQALAATRGVAAVFAELDRIEPEMKTGVERAYWHSHRGEVLAWLGRYGAAREEFERSLAVDPALRWTHVGLAGVAVMTREPELALRELDLAAKNGASEVVMRCWRGEALRRLGRLEEARAELELSVAASPRRLGAWLNLALARKALGDGNGAGEIAAKLRAGAAPLMRASRGSLERALALMRGNRSSWLHSYVQDGRLKILRLLI